MVQCWLITETDQNSVATLPSDGSGGLSPVDSLSSLGMVMVLLQPTQISRSLLSQVTQQDGVVLLSRKWVVFVLSRHCSLPWDDRTGFALKGSHVPPEAQTQQHAQERMGWWAWLSSSHNCGVSHLTLSILGFLPHKMWTVPTLRNCFTCTLLDLSLSEKELLTTTKRSGIIV